MAIVSYSQLEPLRVHPKRNETLLCMMHTVTAFRRRR